MRRAKTNRLIRQRREYGMKNLLLATDLAAESDRAFEQAISLAAMLKSRLHIVHVCPPYPAGQTALDLKKSAEDAIRGYLESFSAASSLKVVITVLAAREIYAEIIEQAERTNVGLIVMGMHGKARLLDMFVGTTIERVIRKGIKPVLMVKEKPLGGYENVLVGTDFTGGSKQALQLGAELAPQSHIHLRHYYDIPDTYIGDKISQFAGDVIARQAHQRLVKFAKENSVVLKKFGVDPQRFECRSGQGAAYPTLVEEAVALKADLIAIGTHSHPSLLPNKIGGTARQILTNPPCDVLVAKGL